MFLLILSCFSIAQIYLYLLVYMVTSHHLINPMFESSNKGIWMNTDIEPYNIHPTNSK
jgi:hypothetical protein